MGVDELMNEYIKEAEEVSFEYIYFGEAYDKELALKKEAFKDGKEEGALSKAKTIAKTMLKGKVDINDISKYTNLSIEEIKSL